MTEGYYETEKNYLLQKETALIYGTGMAKMYLEALIKAFTQHHQPTQSAQESRAEQGQP